ncbi:MAG: hypothetical protein VB099_08965 [Candidatus Limiplasma sp.]|nr:hypothetical protein [Candidatus Limiplasma sp.]
MNRKERKAAESAIKQIAAREGKTIVYIKEQMQMAMLNGLRSADPRIKAYWDRIPRQGTYPTPEEWMVHAAGILRKSGNRDG